jgi:lipopolysaccharide export system permease protein
MILKRAAHREFAGTAAAVFVSLFAILLTTQLIRLLAQAAGGRITPESVIALLGFGAIGYLPVLLSLTAFIAVLLTFARWYRDSEMSIWLTSGMPLTAWIRPVLQFSLPLMVVIAVLSLLLTPWANRQSESFRQRLDQRDDIARVSPGSFNESGSADRVFFVEGVGGSDGLVRNVFISSLQNGRMGVIATASGRTETAANGDRFVVLESGRRYEGEPGTAEFRVMEFERYAVRIESKDARLEEQSPRTLYLWELLRDRQPAYMAEILWRIGVPLSALNLSLLAIPLAFVNPRAGRTNNLIFALLTFMIYSNVMSVSQVWVAQGRTSFVAALSGVHLLMFFVLVLLFVWRQNPLAWRLSRWR